MPWSGQGYESEAVGSLVPLLASSVLFWGESRQARGIRSVFCFLFSVCYLCLNSLDVMISQHKATGSTYLRNSAAYVILRASRNVVSNPLNRINSPRDLIIHLNYFVRTHNCILELLLSTALRHLFLKLESISQSRQPRSFAASSKRVLGIPRHFMSSIAHPKRAFQHPPYVLQKLRLISMLRFEYSAAWALWHRFYISQTT